MKQPQSIDEAALQSAEARIPELAQHAVQLARQQALQTSGRVIEVCGDQLVEMSASGERRVLRDLPPRIAVQRGQILTRRNGR
ncbi:MAG TPA: hypothetical protein PK797_04345 [Burkholderiaceae bacterium]|jgi:hypothetical protein|nr:hypothetical protein [Burkholderiaceae bacterium]